MKVGSRQLAVGSNNESPLRGFLLSLCQLPTAYCLRLFSGEQSVLTPAGPQAGSVSQLWWLMFYVESAVFVLVCVAVLVALFRRRKERAKSSDEPDTSPDPHREQRMAQVIAGAVGLTFVILFVFLVGSYTTGRGLYSASDAQALNVKITGHQWWWEVEYDGEPASSIVRTANEIHIPVGQLVKLRLTADDVIHSFWVPNLSGKKDLIPGHEIILEFQANSPGEFRGQCAEFCGYQHAHMGLTIIAEPPEKFDEWMNGQRAPAAPPASESEQRGQQVFLSAPCIMCHTIRGTDAGGHVAPDLTHLASRKTIAASTLPNARDHLGRWITNSQEIKPGNHMPPVPLKSDELQALLDYLGSLK